MEAWRQQQIAALTETQRGLFDDAQRKSGERVKAKAGELAERKQGDVQERMRRKILETAELKLVLGRGRETISEVLAKRLTEEYFRPGLSPKLTGFEILVSGAAKTAVGEIEREYALELEACRHEERGKNDDLLRNFERAREVQPPHREEFARAAAEGKAKTDFQEASRQGGILQDPIKSEAIARAIARVKEKEEEEEHERGDRDQGRGRSLSDTFNKER